MGNFSDTSCRENENTYFMLSNVFPKGVSYMGKCGRAGDATDVNTIRLMRLACWIAKARDTNSEHVTVIAFALQQLLHDRASMSQVQCLSC
jgi:hypothetical protein